MKINAFHILPACVIQSRYPLKSSSSCCFSRNFWKSPLALAFSLSLENSLEWTNRNQNKSKQIRTRNKSLQIE